MGLEQRIVRLEAEAQIRQLVARYCFTIDDRDLAGVETLFAEDATVRSADGVMFARGKVAIIEQYRGRFSVLGPGQHFMHDIALDFFDDRPDEVHGRVSGHAELWRNDMMMVAALRYDDVYRREGAQWLFADRLISFLYYVPIDQYPGILGTTRRNRAYAEPRDADFPEKLATWQAYEDERGDS